MIFFFTQNKYANILFELLQRWARAACLFELSVQIKKSLIRAELIQNVIFFKISMQNILFEIL